MGFSFLTKFFKVFSFIKDEFMICSASQKICSFWTIFDLKDEIGVWFVWFDERVGRSFIAFDCILISCHNELKRTFGSKRTAIEGWSHWSNVSCSNPSIYAENFSKYFFSLTNYAYFFPIRTPANVFSVGKYILVLINLYYSVRTNFTDDESSSNVNRGQKFTIVAYLGCRNVRRVT